MADDVERQGLSLIIPFFNEEQVLQETLEEVYSFLLKLNHPFELLLGDDGSTDGSADIAKNFVARDPDHIQLVQNEDQSRCRFHP